MLGTVLAFFLATLTLWKIFFPVPRPILGVYSRAGNRGIFKQCFMFLLLKWRKMSSSSRNEVGYGRKLTDDENQLECVKVLFVSDYHYVILKTYIFQGARSKSLSN